MRTRDIDSLTLHSLEVCQKSIRLFGTMRPFYFIGIPASYSLTATFASAAFSFMSAIVGKLIFTFLPPMIFV